MPAGENDRILIEGLVKGDAHAFDEIFKKYNRKVYSFSIRNFKNQGEAEEIVQEVFINLWNDRQKLAQVKNLEAWIFTICFNTIRKHIRKIVREKKHLENFTRDFNWNDNSVASEIEFNDLMKKVDNIIEKLPDRQRHIFLLSNKEGLSNEEISINLKITKKTVENQLSIAKAFIKKTLVDEKLLTLLFFWLFIK